MTTIDPASVRLENWQNVMTRMGTSVDTTRYTVPDGPRLLREEDLDRLFHGNDLAARIVAKPAEECFRRWFEISVGTGQPDDVARARTVQQTLESLNAQRVLAQAYETARLYGGAVVYMGVLDGQNPASPLGAVGPNSIFLLEVFSRYELKIIELNSDLSDPNYGQPELFEFVRSPKDGNKSLLGRRIHASRCLVFPGAPTSRRQRERNDHWWNSVLTPIYPVLRGYGTTWEAAERIMQDFSQVMIKWKDLGETMARPGGSDQFMNRLEIINRCRSVYGLLILDAEYEDYSRQTASIAGLPELLDRWVKRIAAAAEMPVTVLYGESPSGLNATGESDIQNWYATLQSRQQTILRPLVERLVRVVFQSTGGEPDTWRFEWRPLWSPTDQQTVQTRYIQAQIDEKYVNMQAGLTGMEIVRSRFGGDSYSIETHIDGDVRQKMKELEERKVLLSPAQHTVLLGAMESVAAGRIEPEAATHMAMRTMGFEAPDAALFFPAAEALSPEVPAQAPGPGVGDLLAPININGAAPAENLP